MGLSLLSKKRDWFQREANLCERVKTTFGMAITIEENEKAAFLSGDRPGGQVNVGSRPYAKLEAQKKCCFGWSKTKICCCACLGILAALILAITVVCLILFVFDVGDKSGEAKEWEEEDDRLQPEKQTTRHKKTQKTHLQKDNKTHLQTDEQTKTQ